MPAGFPLTSHSVVSSLASEQSDVRRAAFDALATAYWKPVFKYVRLKWSATPDEAADLTRRSINRPNRTEHVVTLSAACKALAAIWSAASMLSASHMQPTTEDQWAPIRFLVGTWEGTSSGRPGDGTVRREYRLVLQDQFIEVRNRSTYPPQARNPKGERHEDAGYISYDRNRKAFVLRQFHVEGFVNTYVAAADVAKTIVFTSEAIENVPSGWRARDTYVTLGPDQFEEVFELAEPAKEFEIYTHARFKRVQ